MQNLLNANNGRQACQGEMDEKLPASPVLGESDGRHLLRGLAPAKAESHSINH